MNLLAMIEKIDDLKRQYDLETDIDRLKWLEREIENAKTAMKEEQAKTTQMLTTDSGYWTVFYKVQELLLATDKKKYQHNSSGAEIPSLTAECDRITNMMLGNLSDDGEILDLISSGDAYVSVTYAAREGHPAYDTFLNDTEECLVDISEFLTILVEAGDEDDISKFIEYERRGVTNVLVMKG